MGAELDLTFDVSCVSLTMEMNLEDVNPPCLLQEELPSGTVFICAGVHGAYPM